MKMISVQAQRTSPDVCRDGQSARAAFASELDIEAARAVSRSSRRTWRTFAALLGAYFLTAAPAFAQADLTVTKTHAGNFTQGQVDAQYTIVVRNAAGVGPVFAGNTVTVVDTLPAGLTATAMAGAGWTCVVASVSCTTNNALAAGQGYPAITLTVAVAADAGSPLLNRVAVSGGGETNTANDAATDPATIVALPPALQNAVSRKVHSTAGTFDLPL